MEECKSFIVDRISVSPESSDRGYIARIDMDVWDELFSRFQQALAEIERLQAELEKYKDALEIALYYAVTPHQAGKDRLNECRKLLKGKKMNNETIKLLKEIVLENDPVFRKMFQNTFLISILHSRCHLRRCLDNPYLLSQDRGQLRLTQKQLGYPLCRPPR